MVDGEPLVPSPSHAQARHDICVSKKNRRQGEGGYYRAPASSLSIVVQQQPTTATTVVTSVQVQNTSTLSQYAIVVAPASGLPIVVHRQGAYLLSVQQTVAYYGSATTTVVIGVQVQDTRNTSRIMDTSASLCFYPSCQRCMYILLL